MIVLGLDCATGPLSAAFVDGDRVLAAHYDGAARGQAEILLPVIESLRRQSGLAWSAVDRLAVTLGPGSFTGVRVALAAARGLAVALERPIVGFSTLEAIALTIPPDTAPLVVALDARRGELYAQRFGADRAALGPPEVLTPAALAAALPAGPVRVAGSGAGVVATASGRADLIVQTEAGPDAAAIARAAITRVPAAAPPEPIYLRGADARLAGGRSAPPRLTAAGLAHLAVLAALHGSAFPHEPWSDAHFHALLTTPGCSGRLILDAGEPVGFAVLRLAGDEAEILTIGLRPASRQRGLGRQLLDDALAWAATAGARSVFLEVAVDNVAALGLYRRAGFTTVGRRPAYYRQGDGRYVDALVLNLLIPPAPSIE